MANVRTRGQAGRIQQPGVRNLPKRSKPFFELNIGKCDYGLVFMVVFMALFGLVMLFSAALSNQGVAVRQLIFVIMGIAGMFAVSIINYHLFNTKLTYLIYIATLLLMISVKFIGTGENGATRWIQIGSFQFQPVELFKIAVIFLNAYLLTIWGKKLRVPIYTLTYLILTLLDLFVVYYFTENLSSAIIVFGISIGMLFIAKPNWKVCAAAIILGVVVVLGYIGYVCILDSTGEILNIEDHWREYRVAMWLFPEKYSGDDKSFQTTQSIIAIISGSWKGKGFGNSTQRFILPEAKNDMVFAIICEELGFLGASFLLIQYGLLLQRLSSIIRNSKELFGSMIVTGVLVHVALQVILNVAVVTGTMPNTGVTLPFVSSGGTAVIGLFIEMGLALSVSRHISLE